MVYLNNEYFADEGKVFQIKDTLQILSSVLYLGVNDSIDNYQQIDIPKVEDADDKNIEIQN